MSVNIQVKPQQADWVEATIWLGAGVNGAILAAGSAFATVTAGVGFIGSAIFLCERITSSHRPLSHKFDRALPDEVIGIALINICCGIGMCCFSRLYNAEINFAKKSFQHFSESL